MTAYERYKKLMLERPEEFRPSEKGLLQIVTDSETIKRYEQETGRKIGVVYESPYHLMVVDLIYGGDDKYYTYERILEQHPGAAVVLPITPKGDIVLLKQFRHSIRDEQYGLPRGFGTAKMTAEENARKEAGEEIGADDAKPILLGEVIANSGLSGVRVKVFLFKVHDYRTIYGNEGIVEAAAYSKTTIDQMIKSGKINDGFTLSAYTLYCAKFSK